ncbi:unnamed protein product [Lepeophtheirus salmonis]|uniref:(salmon louse) hypothetical protein n=1 Tax=Lepeophtheirus salmonis TaxID=72036 RepID=A0A7R8D292_LEPSM|nr:unnamed protein product [Lepeophtheirus salmonis]CAF2955252.1 unnamed protein product [Lepeophtheirus salmonis]
MTIHSRLMKAYISRVFLMEGSKCLDFNVAKDGGCYFHARTWLNSFLLFVVPGKELKKRKYYSEAPSDHNIIELEIRNISSPQPFWLPNWIMKKDDFKRILQSKLKHSFHASFSAPSPVYSLTLPPRFIKCFYYGS